MKRKALSDLKNWINSKTRKPLILRGARQVGKSTLVRLFAEQEKLQLIELNLEIEKLKATNLENFNLNELIDEIQFKTRIKITENCLIFFDEIQESPDLIKCLRYFYELMPHLKIIAAGSLLEIVINNSQFSFPVGRVDFYHLGPMTFREFLWATKQEFLDEKLANFVHSNSVHLAALTALKTYFYTGGMPAAVKHYIESNSLFELRSIQNQILQTYQADFPKYNKRIDVKRIERIFSTLAIFTGKKIIYSKLDTESTSRDIKRVVELLIDAKVILPCTHSEGNLIPLLGESDSKIFKTYFLDIGLLNAILKMDVDLIDYEFKTQFNAKGFLAEQFVAQHLFYCTKHSAPPGLIYHLKDKGTQKAEIDFLIETQGKIFPIEVKSSASGHLKSLKYFSEAKQSSLSFKFSLAQYSEESKFTKTTKLINMPIYFTEYLYDFLENKLIV